MLRPTRALWQNVSTSMRHRGVKTAELCDQHTRLSALNPFIHIVSPALPLRDYGGNTRFHGRVATVRCNDDNQLVRDTLASGGRGRVLVVDNGGSLRCAPVGDQLAALGRDNGWRGVLVNGCVRDSDALSTIPFGVKALSTHPLRGRRDEATAADSTRNEPVRFGGVTFLSGMYVWCDSDGVVVVDREWCV